MVQHLHGMSPADQYVRTLHISPWSQSKEMAKRKQYFRQKRGTQPGTQTFPRADGLLKNQDL